MGVPGCGAGEAAVDGVHGSISIQEDGDRDAFNRLEPGESVAKASRRELKEETGLRAGKLARLLTFFPSPGFLDEKMHLVRATELKQSPAAPEEDERIRIRWFSKRELRDFLQKGKIRDGKTLVGLLWHLKRGG